MNDQEALNAIAAIVLGWEERVACSNEGKWAAATGPSYCGVCGIVYIRSKGEAGMPFHHTTIPNPLRARVLPLVTVECRGCVTECAWSAGLDEQGCSVCGIDLPNPSPSYDGTCFATLPTHDADCPRRIPRKLADMWRGPEPMRAEVELAYWRGLCKAMGWELDADNDDGAEPWTVEVWDEEERLVTFAIADTELEAAAAAVLAAFEKEVTR